MKFSPMTTSCTAIISLLVAVPAMAHTGHIASTGVQAGLAHPFSGLDHMLAMLAIGCWAAMQKKTLQFSIPLTFIVFLAAGFFLAIYGAVLPLIEHTIAVSVLFCGLIIATAVRLPALISLGLTALFATAHGQAHGIEIAAGSAFLFALGFIASSIALHLTGIGAIKYSRSIMPQVTRVAGAAIATVGTFLLVTV